MLPVGSFINTDEWQRFDMWESELRETFYLFTWKLANYLVWNLDSNWQFSPCQETNNWVLPHAALAGGRTTREAVKTAWLPPTCMIFLKNSSLKRQFCVFVDSSRGRGCVNNAIWFSTFKYTYRVSAGVGQERKNSCSLTKSFNIGSSGKGLWSALFPTKTTKENIKGWRCLEVNVPWAVETSR